MHRNRFLRTFMGLLVILLVGSFSFAQSLAGGAIQGTVTDATGAVVSGANLTARNAANGAEYKSTSSDQGLFSFPVVPVGTYEITADKQGFAQIKSSVNVTVGGKPDLSLVFKVAGQSQEMNVTSEAPLVETSRTAVSSTVSERLIKELPVNGRNFIEFALLTPGVTRDPRSGDISFAGQRGTLNSLVVDGADNNNTFFGQTLGRTGSGRAPYQFSQDAVQEFQVNSSAYSAEYGRAGGAVINVVTKSGSNTPHGTIFEFYRDKALNANDAINVLNNRPKSPYHYNQFGGSFGGPIQKFHHFVFANYDGQRNTQPNDVFVAVPPGTTLDATGTAGLAQLTGLAQSWTRGQDQDVFLVKTDSQLKSDRRLTLRYNHQNFTGRNFENSGPQNALEHTGDSKVRTRSLNGTFSHGLTSTMLNEARAQWARDQEPGFANSDNPEAIVRQGGSTVLTIGRNSFSPRETTITRGQLADTVTWSRGTHFIRMGAGFQFDRILNYFPGNFAGSYQFNSLSSFQLGTPNGAGERYLQAFAGPDTSGATTHPDIDEYSAFVQDEWRARGDLTVHAGLRYDLQKF